MTNHWNTSNPYSAGNSFSSALSQINAAGLLEPAVAFITERQNPETGLWGEGLSYINSNAAMKLAGFYSASGTPFPYIDKMIESITTIIMEGDNPGAVVDIWNPIVAINSALASYEQISPELRESLDQVILPLVELSIENIKPFKRDDGGFSYNRKNSSINSQGAYVGYGLEEGDVNATRIATTRLRSSLYQMAGVERPPLFEDTDFVGEILQQWENLPPVQKIEKPIGLDEDFEDVELERLPARYTRTVSGGNQIEVASDPLNPDNQALLIGRNALNSNSRLLIPVYSGDDTDTPQKITVSMDIMIESPATGTLFYNQIGTGAVQWVISGHSNGFSLSNRSSQRGIGTTFGDRLAYGEWHKLKIEYIPDGKHYTVINYYINDEFVFTTNEYFNDGNADQDPETSIDIIRFDNFNAAGILNFYVDNLLMTMEETVLDRLTGLNENFENIKLGNVPFYFQTNVTGGNQIEVTPDPVHADNQVLMIKRNALNSHSRLNIPVRKGVSPYQTEVSLDIMIESPIVGTLFYNKVGTDAIQWVITGRSNGFILSNRSSERGTGTAIADPLPYGEWHHLKIEYIPGGIDHTIIRYYLNDELIFTTNEYFNDGNPENKPASIIDHLSFDNFNAAGIMTLYIDNLRMSVEPISTSRMLERIHHFVNEDAFANEQALHALNIHLTSLQVFEQQENTGKLLQYIEGFLMLLDYQKERELISEQAYNVIKADADMLMGLWQEATN